jgi:formimidoylglutamate deiminase
MATLYLPELMYVDGIFQANLGLLVGDDGSILASGSKIAADGHAVVSMPGRAVLPGLVNGHSHSFQRLIRGAAEHGGPNGDDFWAWRNRMYAAAAQLTPEQLYDVARMAFLEMALNGITTVGEFHYVHRDTDGTAYADPNTLAKAVIRAATSVGLRIALLRVAYIRAGFDLPPNPGQKRFYETPQEYIESVTQLEEALPQLGSLVSMGVAPHSIRAVPLDDLKTICAWANERKLPIHMHAAEQQAEIAACTDEYGAPPIALLAQHGLLNERFTLVHAIHTTPEEVAAITAAKATICSCPTTERNLGDGIIDAHAAASSGVAFSFGSDSQATINLLEDARELDYHLRLRTERRVPLDGIGDKDLSERLFGYATTGGARSLGLPVGELSAGHPADFFAIDLHDIAIAGATPKELLPTIVFSLDRSAVTDVFVNGRAVIRAGRHPLASEIITRYEETALRIEAHEQQD